ncbi:MAG: prepilin peptidase [Patescibacteria group bacterium]
MSFILGLFVGSFLNVLILRTVAGESFITGRSHCPQCGVTLSFLHMLPVVSYLALAGKCAKCQSSISLQYPVVEFVTGCCFALLASSYAPAELSMLYPYLLKDFVITMGLLALFVFDARWYAVPDAVALPVAGVAAFLNILLGMPWRAVFLGAAVGAGLYAVLWVVSRGRWVGDGDIRLGAVVGAAVGWPGTLAALYVSYLIGGVVAIALVATGRKELGGMLPMGTFLMAATFFVLLFPERIAVVTNYFLSVWH